MAYMFTIDMEFPNLEDALDRVILAGIKKKYQDKVGTMKCSEHNQHAKLTLIGKDIENLSIKVSGCCAKFIREVKEALKG